MSSLTYFNCLLKQWSGPGLLFAGRFLIIVSISLLVMGLLRFSISSWFRFGKLYFSKNLSISSRMWLIFESWNILASCILQTLILPSVPKAQYRSLNTLVLKIWWTCMISSSTLSSILSTMLESLLLTQKFSTHIYSKALFSVCVYKTLNP